MNSKLFVILAVAAASGFAGCRKGEDKTPVSNERINIVAGIDPIVTRTPQLGSDGSGVFADGDSFSLLAFGASGKSTLVDYAVNKSQLYWKDVQSSAADGKISFAACYPVQNIDGGSFAFDLAAAADKDLLMASVGDVTVGTSDKVSLRFRHAMHRLVINYTVDESASVSASEIETSCTAKSSCRVDLVAGSVDSSAASKSQFAANGGSVSFLLVPQACSDVEVTVKAGELSTTFTVDEKADACDMLEGGKQLTLSLTVKADRIEIGDIVIDGWGDQGTVEGEIIM